MPVLKHTQIFRSWRLISDTNLNKKTTRAIWDQQMYQNPYLMLWKVLEKRNFTPTPIDLQILHNFHWEKSKSPILSKSNILPLFNSPWRRNREFLALYFTKVWGFDIKARSNHFEWEIELKFRLILCLSRFYDVKFTQLDTIGLDMIGHKDDNIWFLGWNKKAFLVFPEIFKQTILKIIKETPKWFKWTSKWSHGNRFCKKETITSIISSYQEISPDYDYSINLDWEKLK